MARGTASAPIARAVPLLVAGLACLAGCGRQDDDPPLRTPAEPEIALPPICIGAEPPPGAWSAEPSGESPPLDDGGLTDLEPEIGSPAPRWALRDFQPQSCGYEAVYGLEASRGMVTVVAVWSGA